MLDVAALQRELDAGVSPDLTADVHRPYHGSHCKTRLSSVAVGLIKVLTSDSPSFPGGWSLRGRDCWWRKNAYTSPCPRRIAVYIPPTSSSSSTGSCKQVLM